MTITPPATPPSPRLATMFGSLVTAIPSLAIAGTAFLYFAGYVFLDTYRRSLGLAFGSVETSTAEILAQGYIVLWYAVIARFWYILVTATVPALLTLLAILSAGVLLVMGRKRGWRGCAWTIDVVRKGVSRVEALPNYLLFVSVAAVALVSAWPAGALAARVEYRASIENVRRGCCFRYTGRDAITATGYVVAADHDRLFVLTRAGTVAVPTEGLTIVPLDRRPTLASLSSCDRDFGRPGAIHAQSQQSGHQ